MTTPSPEVVRTKVELCTIYEKKWSTLLSLWRKDSTVFRTMNAYLEGGAALGILIVELTISRAVASIKTADQIAIAITNLCCRKNQKSSESQPIKQAYIA
jgi:hypothetical protein